MTEHTRIPVLPELRRWRLAPDAWRLAGRVTPARLERYLRYRSARALPESMKARFRAMGIPQQTINEVLGGIRGLGQWMDGWNLAAQRFLAEARGEERSGRWHEAAIARVNAAMCFHIAHLVTDTDPRTLRTLRASCVTTFAQAAPRLMPQVRKIALPWRTRSLPAYVAIPTRGDRPHPTLVMLNGATTCKEELLIWTMPLLEEGIAVMTVDWPGTGESASFTSPVADCDDMTDGIIEFVAGHPDLDEEWVVVGGISLGGAVAVRCAAFDRRLLGAMAVTPPYDPLAWWPYVNPLVRLQLMTLAYNADSPVDVIGDFGVGDLVPRLRSPLLVFGAGRDMVVPAEESIALASAAGELATLVWYPEGGHGLYHELDDWIALTGEWLNGLVGRGDVVMPEPETLAPAREVQPAAVTSAAAQPEERPPAVDRTVAEIAPDSELESTRVDSVAAAEEPQPIAATDETDEGEARDADEDDIWGD